MFFQVVINEHKYTGRLVLSVMETRPDLLTNSKILIRPSKVMKYSNHLVEPAIRIFQS